MRTPRPIPAPLPRPAPRDELRTGADPNSKNEDGDTPLHYAVSHRRRRSAVWWWDRIDCCDALDADVEGVVRLLLDGADPNSRDKDSYTPLHYAADKDNTDLTRVLLAADADPNLKSVLGDTPLHRAAQYGKPAVVRMLLDAGADPDALGCGGCTPLHRATQNRRLESVELLLQHYANPHIKNIDGHAALDTVRPEDTRIRELLRGAAGVAPSSFPRPGEY